jgi:capsular polysaccharide biosynthesis protein
MSFPQLIRLIKNHLILVVFLPLLIAALVFFLTRNEKREYTANTLIYTGLLSGYTIESGQGSRIDYLTVNNDFDNLINTVKSRSTLEEVGVRLLATHLMLPQPKPAIANAQTLKHLQTVIPESVRKQVVDPSSLERTMANIYRYAQIPKNVIAEKLLNTNDEPYSAKGITAKLTAAREGTSDMVRLSYLSNDPAVVKQTLELITLVFMRRYREIKVSETGNAVAYFEEQPGKATGKLAGSEERMKAFSTGNKIINFYEQTKYVSARDRDIDLGIQKEKTDQFAPIGSTLNRLEREIGVAEREYLKILHGLNQSKLREQNLLLSTNLKVLDAPKFPDKPEDSNRILLTVMAFIVGFVLAIGFIIGKAYFDKSIKNPERAEQFTGLRFTGALPSFHPDKKQVAWAAVERQTLNQIISKLKKWSNQQTQVVVVASSGEGEGKSFFTKKLVRQLNQCGIRSIIKPAAEFQLQPRYEFAGDFEEDDELFNSFEKYQYVFVEIPALLHEPIPTEITKKAAFTLWICDATRAWTTADRYVLTAYQDTILTPIGLVLNRMALDDMDAISSEFKKRKKSFLKK